MPDTTQVDIAQRAAGIVSARRAEDRQGRHYLRIPSNVIEIDRFGARNRDWGALRNKKWEVFALELCTGAPAQVAYASAGFDGTPGHANAYRLAANPEVQARVDELKSEVYSIQHHLLDKIEWIRSQFYGVFAFDPLSLYDPVPGDERALKLKPLARIPEAVRRHITKIKTDPETDHPTEISFTDKSVAANLLLRSMPGGDVTRHEHTGAGGGPIRVVAVAALVDWVFAPEVISSLDDASLGIWHRIGPDLRRLAARIDSSPTTADAEPTK